MTEWCNKKFGFMLKENNPPIFSRWGGKGVVSFENDMFYFFDIDYIGLKLTPGIGRNICHTDNDGRLIVIGIDIIDEWIF
jgi:hypothetical protein